MGISPLRILTTLLGKRKKVIDKETEKNLRKLGSEIAVMKFIKAISDKDIEIFKKSMTYMILLNRKLIPYNKELSDKCLTEISRVILQYKKHAEDKYKADLSFKGKYNQAYDDMHRWANR